MSYKITKYTKDRAKAIGAVVKPSKDPKKKLDVFSKDGVFLTSVGAMGYKDYPTYMKEKGKEFADERRRLYKKRHQNNRTKEGSDGWFADQLLW
jgi:hypothetical protein